MAPVAASCLLGCPSINFVTRSTTKTTARNLYSSVTRTHVSKTIVAGLGGLGDPKKSNPFSNVVAPGPKPPAASAGTSAPGVTSSREEVAAWRFDSFGKPPHTTQQNIDSILNVSVLVAVGVVAMSKLVGADSSIWDLYQESVTSNPIETKAAISGMVYAFGDLIAQTYEGRDISEWDRARVIRSGLCGLLAHGPLSHLYYLGIDHVFTNQHLLPSTSWFIPLAKMGIDQTVWSVFWNSTYYVLLGLLKFESPAVIARTVKNSWWDLLKAGWRLWPMVHVITYGVIPVQHRLLFVDAVELVWVSILSLYGQQQRSKNAEALEPSAVACALPGGDGEGGDFAEEILRSLRVEHQVVLQDADGNETIIDQADLAEMYHKPLAPAPVTE